MMSQDPIKTPEYKALIHILCNMEFTGVFYQGSQKDYFVMLDQQIKKHRERYSYTPAEDNAILGSKNLAETAQALGRSEASLCSRRAYLRRRKQNDQNGA